MRVAALVWLVACGGNETPTARTGAGCNGALHLCDLAVDEVAFLRTHNSHASEERGYTQLSWNHFEAIPTQLRDGVRALNLDVYEQDGALTLCHGICGLGSQPFDEALSEIEQFLVDHPRQVVLLDFQDETPAGRLEEGLSAHSLSRLRLDQAPGDRWPTLAEMIEDETTLVVLDGHTYETGWSYWTPEDLDCAPTTDPARNLLYEVTHVLTNPLASPANAEQINHQPVIGDHVQRCLDEVGFINLLSVDFYSIGDAVPVVAELNAPRP